MIELEKITWREGEISYREFVRLPQQKKEEHLSFLIEMDAAALSYNDKMIINRYLGENYNLKTNKFLEL